jgi:hypothetical protein
MDKETNIIIGTWEDNPHLPLPSNHDWVEDLPGYQYKCTKCGLVMFKRKFALGGGWGISCESKVQGEPNTQRPSLWSWFIPNCNS